MQPTKIQALGLSVALALASATPAEAGGTLKPKGSPEKPIEILDHSVEVVINNGFARTEVDQTFYNPNANDLEAIYSFPLPKSASLSEMVIYVGEREMAGEVIRAEEARRVYEEKRDKGEDAGLAVKNDYKTFEFSISIVPAMAESRFRFVYYQPLEIDTGVGRYVYPLEDGGTDEVALAFWDTETEVRRSFSFHAELVSAWPIDDLRLPGLEAAAAPQQIDAGRWEVSYDAPGGVSLDRDIVLYYRLQDDLPGRVELVPYRSDPDGTGTFMLVLTPGVDLEPLTGGADYVFVLDTSGSMKGKIQTLVDGVVRAMGELNPNDRFRIITFSDKAHDLTGGFESATLENVQRAVDELHSLKAGGSTNLYAPLKKALRDLDDDRATSLVLVTDAVTNTGELSPLRFRELLKSHDVRFFGFLLGNSANWPLMKTMCKASGGFYAGISNADDIVGQLLLAKSKVTHEALHDVDLSFNGARVHDVTEMRSKVYRGEQLVLFGRYSEPGPLEVVLKATITGEERTFKTSTVLPAIDVEAPELERLWALDHIEEIQLAIDGGDMPDEEGEDAIADLGVAYQIVTDHTSMLVLEDVEFDARGIDRANRERVQRETEAQNRRRGQVARSYRVDTQEPAFPDRAPTTRGSGGSGGGAIDPLSLILILLTGGLLISSRRRGVSVQ